jgi:formate hydrogenlyase transcriptional activator
MITSIPELAAPPHGDSGWKRTESFVLPDTETGNVTGDRRRDEEVGNAWPKEQTLLQLLYALIVGPALAEVRVLQVWLQQPEAIASQVPLLMNQLTAYPRVDVELSLDDSIASWVWQHQRPLIIAAKEETRFPDFARRLLEKNVEYFCAVPFMVANRRIGILGLAGTRQDAFGSFELAFVQREATNSASAAKGKGAARQLPQIGEPSGGKGSCPEDADAAEDNFEGIIGRSAGIKALRQQVKVVAPTGSTVLILGETGSGKERFAQALHHLSPRGERPFIKVNCAAIPAGLIESELFGHERGAFTGAIGRRTGRFEMAHGGTLFLDEIGDIPLELQPKLLRVLQEQEFERVGGTQTTQVDVRIVAATSRDLSRMVAAREFRADLYYRLNVFPLRVPALRERPEDIPLLVRHFVGLYSGRAKKRVTEIPLETMEAFLRYPWPGNVRELQNVVERSVILSPGKVLRADLDEFRGASEISNAVGGGCAHSPVTLKDVEREHIIQALAATNWVVGGPNGAAARIGLARSSLIAKMQKLGITRAQA